MRVADRRTYQEVADRDRGCVAPLVDPTQVYECGPEDVTAPRTSRFDQRHWEREHVRYEAAMGGRRITVVDGVVILCSWHHRGSRAGVVWALAHKDELHAYLARVTTRLGVA